jgi:tetratricopeptide (TPR) repeat protein
MNRIIHYSLNGSKTWIIAISLVILPWLGSIYFCSRTPSYDPLNNRTPPTKVAFAKELPPDLLPDADSVRCLLAGDSPSISASDGPLYRTNQDYVADGPVLAEPMKADKTGSLNISQYRIAAENDFDASPTNPSPPVWMPVEMPIAQQAADPLPEPSALSMQPSSDEGKTSDVGMAVELPYQQKVLPLKQPNDIHAKSANKTESTPKPNMSETLANLESSAELVPAAQRETVEDQSATPAIDQEIVYPSTEPLLAKSAAVNDLPVRSEQLESIARQADQQTRYGYELAGRGAYFAARSEFIAALRLVAQGLDTDGRTKIHGKSLAAGLTALKEAEDFMPGDCGLEADLNLPEIIGGHDTPVLKDADKSSITTLTAMNKYYTFAQEQLAQAAGSEVAGSMALHALGKLHEELIKGKISSIKAAGPKAMVFYQASLLVCPKNFMAANDLGAMLARGGQYEDARKMLEHSYALSRGSTVLHNLAVVYEHLGYKDMAQRTRQQAEIAMQMEQANKRSKLVSAGGQVRWVDETAFAQSANRSGIRQGYPAQVAATANPVMQPVGPVSSTSPSFPLPSPANASAGQTASAVARPMPALQPAATGWNLETSYDARR